VAIATRTFGRASPAALARLRAAGFTVATNPVGRVLSREETVELLDGASGLLAGNETLDAWVLARAPRLRVISRVGTGLDNVDVAAAERHGVRVFRTADAPVPAVAELALGMMLALLRAIPAADAGVRGGGWSAPLGTLLGGKTVGIVGLGRIGCQLARLLAPFGVERLGSDPSADACRAAERLGVRTLPLDELLAASDVVSLHLALDAGTRGLLDARRIAGMKRGAWLVNLSRGGVVDEEALAAALESGALRGAALDVFAVEPYVGPLCARSNVVLTPHMGSSTVETRARMELEAVENLLRGLDEEASR
jgi:D-3-phosphoglycerate dehydrogenase